MDTKRIDQYMVAEKYKLNMLALITWSQKIEFGIKKKTLITAISGAIIKLQKKLDQ